MSKSRSIPLVIRDNYISFGILGFAIVISVAGLFILIANFSEQIVAALYHEFDKGAEKELEWRADGLLQLQRHAPRTKAPVSGSAHRLMCCLRCTKTRLVSRYAPR